MHRPGQWRGMTRTTLRLSADPASLERAADILRAGGLVAFPTETVYGLGADATNGRAVAAIYEAKGRPSFNPLIAHVSDVAAARRQGLLSQDAERLASAFWPGPMTLVVPMAGTCEVSDIATAGLESLALRVPAHPLARSILAMAGMPVAAPSANRSGHVSPTMAAHVEADLCGRIDAIVDGGPTDVGLESTIFSCLDGPVRLLRPGGVTREAAEAVLGHPLEQAPDAPADNPLAPGMLASHYAPRARVRLDAEAPRAGEAWLGFGADPLPHDEASLNLSPSGDLVEAAANLFGMLRRLDATGAHTIAVAPIPDEGLGEAIRDRLARAAAQR
jgi:L-threonylcarbamoyladenylate synthase